jgi:hypothetical protein
VDEAEPLELPVVEPLCVLEPLDPLPLRVLEALPLCVLDPLPLCALEPLCVLEALWVDPELTELAVVVVLLARVCAWAVTSMNTARPQVAATAPPITALRVFAIRSTIACRRRIASRRSCSRLASRWGSVVRLGMCRD